MLVLVNIQFIDETQTDNIHRNLWVIDKLHRVPALLITDSTILGLFGHNGVRLNTLGSQLSQLE